MNLFQAKRGGALLLAVILADATPSRGQAQSPSSHAAMPAAVVRGGALEPQTIRLVIHARATARPALQHRLLPDDADRTPGNAASLYLLAFLQAAQIPDASSVLSEDVKRRYADMSQDARDLTDLYLELPLERLPQGEVDRFLKPYDVAFRLLDQAALRDHCRWDLPIREEGFDLSLAHLNHARRLTNLMNVRTRLLLAKGDQSAALRSLQSGFALTRALDDESILLQALVGAGVGAATLGRGVAEWVQRPDAPNLYWPLASLPRPFIDLHAALGRERAWLLQGFPQLRRLKTGRFTAEEWREVSEKMVRATGGDRGKDESVAAALQAVASGTIAYGQAKRWLSEQGVPAAQIDAMPVALAVAQYHFGQYETWYDEMLKWTALPFPEAYAGLQRTTDELTRSREDNPLLRTIPAVAQAYYNGVNLDRQIAAMQTVEAIRAYAAAHEGRPPPDLASLQAEGAPAPADPLRGRAFDYEARGDGFTLSSPPPAGMRPSAGLRVEATLVK